MPLRRPVASYFADTHLHEELESEGEAGAAARALPPRLTRSAAAGTVQILVARLQPEDPRMHELPQGLNRRRYNSLWPLPTDGPPRHLAGQARAPHRTASRHTTPAHATTRAADQVLKVTRAEDGCCYAVRRWGVAPRAAWATRRGSRRRPPARRIMGCRIAEAVALQMMTPWLRITGGHLPLRARARTLRRC
jgi:hypothetical protein